MPRSASVIDPKPGGEGGADRDRVARGEAGGTAPWQARRRSDLIVGTSAGSVLAAALRCGIGIDEMIAHQRGEQVGPLEAAAVDGLTSGPWPPAPQLRQLRLTGLPASRSNTPVRGAR